jgi:hypothetical protein
LRTGAMLGRMALGLAIIYLIHPIPWMGHLVGFVVLVWGLGAISIAAYKRIRPAITTATAA